VMNKLLIVLLLFISGQIKSQITLCDCEEDPELIQSCMVTNLEISKKYQIKSIIRYVANKKLKDYKSTGYVKYQFNDSFYLINERLYRNDTIRTENYFYWDSNNQLIKTVRKCLDSSYIYFGPIFQNEQVEYHYKDGKIIERILTHDNIVAKHIKYIYNDVGQLFKIYWIDSNKSRLIKEIHYRNNLVDSVFFDTNQGLKTYKYDLNKNITEEFETYSFWKKPRILKTDYKYDNRYRIIEKKVTNSDYPGFLIHTKVEYGKNGKKEIVTQYNEGNVSSVNEIRYNVKEKITLLKVISGHDKGKYEINNYDPKTGLIVFRERNKPLDRQFWIYEQK
jgi:hypothetical protein